MPKCSHLGILLTSMSPIDAATGLRIVTLTKKIKSLESPISKKQERKTFLRSEVDMMLRIENFYKPEQLCLNDFNDREPILKKKQTKKIVT